jgi:DNA-binding transcriptional MocR family regulator
MAEIGQAARLPGQTLALFLALHHQTTLTGKAMVTSPRSLLAMLGIGKDAKARALRQLEQAGLVTVERAAAERLASGCALLMIGPQPPSHSVDAHDRRTAAEAPRNHLSSRQPASTAASFTSSSVVVPAGRVNTPAG